MNDLISVIVPVYNTERYLSVCVDSILNQTYKNIEVILIDDGSPDGSPVICDAYAAKDDRVKVIHKENGGVHTARNAGIDQARGKYLIFVDSDDWLSDNMLEEMFARTKNNMDIVRCNYVREFPDKSLIKNNTILQEKQYSHDECVEIGRMLVGLVHEELSHPEEQNVLASTCICLYKRTLLMDHNIRFQSIREYGSFEDGLFNIQAFMYMKSFVYIDKPFYHYRKFDHVSITTGYKTDFLSKYEKQFEYIQLLTADVASTKMEEAIRSRIVLSILGMSLNAVRNPGGKRAALAEIKSILRSQKIYAAANVLDMSCMPLKWKLYYTFAKKRMALAVLTMTLIISKLIERGTK